MGERPVVVLVDVYAATMRLTEAFRAAGYDCLRLQSTTGVPPVWRAPFNLETFVGNIVHQGDLCETLAQVASYDPMAIVACGEPGVDLADRLAEILNVPGNGSALSESRRDKHVQVETVKAAGLRGVEQLRVSSAEELAGWHERTGGRVVVKPLRSAGNDGVRFCDSPAESVAAYESILNTASVYLYPNTGVVAQEYLFGTEYIVNTVSRDGCHRATDLWRYSKISANGILDRINGAFSVAEDCPHRETLTRYAFAVLDALGVLHGPAHLEIMLTPTGPCLVEAGIRLCGADTAYYADLAGGESQIDWTVRAYTDPDGFHAHHQDPFQLRRNVVMSFFTSPASGTLRSYPRMNAVKELESFHDVRLNVRPGERLPMTVDDVSEPLMVSLAHSMEPVVERDFATLCYLDGPGFYELEPA